MTKKELEFKIVYETDAETNYRLQNVYLQRYGLENLLKIHDTAKKSLCCSDVFHKNTTEIAKEYFKKLNR